MIFQTYSSPQVQIQHSSCRCCRSLSGPWAHRRTDPPPLPHRAGEALLSWLLLGGCFLCRYLLRITEVPRDAEARHVNVLQ